MTRYAFALTLIASLLAGSIAGLRAAAAENVATTQPPAKPRAMIGAYYFDGWAGKNKLDGNAPWAANAPTHLTQRLAEEFGGRKPIWGSRDDTPEIMERQIDLAADSGLGFFAFCWYFHPDPNAVAADSKHTGMNLFVTARNNRRMKFCLMVANHAGYMLKTPENWDRAAQMWLPYLKHPQALTIGGKPAVILFNANDCSKEGLQRVQDAAIKAGLPGVTFVSCGAAPAGSGLTVTTHYAVGTGWEKGLEEHKYAELTQSARQSWKGSPQTPHIPCLMAGWDKRPWEEKVAPEDPKAKGMCWYFPDRSPELFAAQVADAIAWMDAHPEQATAERLAIIYAWNELGEGGYMVPTQDDPRGKFLGALRSAVFGSAK